MCVNVCVLSATPPPSPPPRQAFVEWQGGAWAPIDLVAWLSFAVLYAMIFAKVCVGWGSAPRSTRHHPSPAPPSHALAPP